MTRRGLLLIMPIFLLAWFFVSGNHALAAEMPQIAAGDTSNSFGDWKPAFFWQHTVSGDDPLLLVVLHTSGNYINSATYNGQAMTLAAKQLHNQPFGNLAVFIYYLANPPAGTHAVEVKTSFTPPVLASAITL